MTDLTPVIEGIVTLAVAIITAFIIPYIKEKIGAAKYAKMVEWVRVAVKAAEMIYKGTGLGAEKKAFVVEFLLEKGFTVDAGSLDALIESAVLEIQKN
jgi:hypothetical protein